MWFVLAHIHPIVQYDVYSQEPQLHVEPLAGEWSLQPHRKPLRVRGRSQYRLSQLLAPLLERVVEMAWKPLAAALFSHCPVIASHHA